MIRTVIKEHKTNNILATYSRPITLNNGDIVYTDSRPYTVVQKIFSIPKDTTTILVV